MPVTLTEVQGALAAFDALMTAADFVSDRIEEGKKAGLITPQEQSGRLGRIDAIRNKVGLPAPASINPPPNPDSSGSAPPDSGG